MLRLVKNKIGWMLGFHELFFIFSPAAWKFIDAELMQKRFLVGLGPSLNTWPRWAPHLEQVTSVRILSGFAISSSRLPPTSRRVLTPFSFSEWSDSGAGGQRRDRIIECDYSETNTFFYCNRLMLFFLEASISNLKGLLVPH